MRDSLLFYAQFSVVNLRFYAQFSVVNLRLYAQFSVVNLRFYAQFSVVKGFIRDELSLIGCVYKIESILFE